MRAEAGPSLGPFAGSDAWLEDAADEFLSPAYLRLAAALAMPDGFAPLFITVRDEAGIALLLPLMRAGGRMAALTTPYTCLWAPLFRPGLSLEDARRAARASAWIVRQCGVTRLDALDAAAPATAWLRRGFADAGLIVRQYAHFAAWTGNVAGADAEAYLAARPGALRATLRRKGRRVTQAGLAIRVFGGEAGAASVADYEAVAARSWKPAEPFPTFLRAWMEAACRDGTGRIGLLCRAGTPVAAQFWTLHGGRARVHKLVHDEAGAEFSPGTVLTAAMCRAMLDAGAEALDFGRGDDPYKASWVGDRAMRSGLLVVAPWHAAGLTALLRHKTGRLISLVRKRRPGEQDPEPRRHQADEQHRAALRHRASVAPARLDRRDEAEKSIDHPSHPSPVSASLAWLHPPFCVAARNVATGVPNRKFCGINRFRKGYRETVRLFATGSGQPAQNLDDLLKMAVNNAPFKLSASI